MNTPARSDAEQIAAAVNYAADAHDGHFRKRAADDVRPKIPYLSHLLGVAGLVIEDHGDLDDTIAALLHDVIEDRNEEGNRPREIEAEFGSRVLAIVESCTGPKQDDPGMTEFRVRKQVYLDHLKAERQVSAIRVSLADKVHNARSTVNDLEADGPQMWRRFHGEPADQLWWYTGLAAAYDSHAGAGRAEPARAAELRRLVDRMHELTPLP